MSDGTLSVRRRQPKASEAAAAADGLLSASALRVATLESFLGGVLPTIGQPRIRDRTNKKPAGDMDEFKVESKRRRRLKEYDRFLKGFKYSAALDSALRKVSTTLLVAESGLTAQGSSKFPLRPHSRSSKNLFIVMAFEQLLLVVMTSFSSLFYGCFLNTSPTLASPTWRAMLRV
jgi:UTP15 C terminal